ncbi:MAG TPA: DoxX family protein [Terriglobales bacterium]|nr:DoxX family protein [Terriglobales bacterium]
MDTAKETTMKVLLLLGRLLFGGFFLGSGLNHFVHHTALAEMVAAAGYPLPELAVIGSGVLIFLGGASILLGAWPRVGAWLIVIFLVFVTPLVNNFWADVNNPQQFADDLNNFTKNVGLLGGVLMSLFIQQPWPYSVDEMVSRSRQTIPVESEYIRIFRQR